MTTELIDLDIFEISLVDKGANPGAKVFLFKRDRAIAKGEAMTLEDVLAQLDEEAKAVVMQALADAQRENAEPDAEPMPEPDKEPEPIAEAEDPKPEDDEEVKKRDKEIATLRKRVQALEDEKVTESVTKRATVLFGLLGTTEQKAELLKAADAMLPAEIAKYLGEVLLDAQSKIEKSDDLGELGSAAPGEGTQGAKAELRAASEALAKKEGITREQAVARIYKTNRALVVAAAKEG